MKTYTWNRQTHINIFSNKIGFINELQRWVVFSFFRLFIIMRFAAIKHTSTRLKPFSCYLSSLLQWTSEIHWILFFLFVRSSREWCEHLWLRESWVFFFCTEKIEWMNKWMTKTMKEFTPLFLPFELNQYWRGLDEASV